MGGPAAPSVAGRAQSAYRTGVALEAGLTASLDRTVADVHTAVALGSGDVPVLATPQVLAWCEEATVAAVAAGVTADETTVGMRVRLDHVRATPVGVVVRIEACLAKVEGRRLTFDVVASDDRGEIASGQVIRVLVDRGPFLDRAGA